MILLDFPCHVQFELSTMCGGMCIICPNQEIQKIRESMSPLILDKIIRELGQNREKIVTVTPLIHGEPLEYPDIISVISKMANIVGRNKIILVTNGQLRKELRSLIWMVELEHIRTLIFSVDGFDNYKSVRVGLNPYDIYENITWFISLLTSEKNKSKVRVDMTVCKENYKDLPEFAEYWNSRGINWNFSPCDNRFSEEQAITSPSILPCRCLWESVFILSDGRVVPCCVDWRGENAMGDIHEDSMATIWNSEAYDELRALHLNGEKKKNALCARCKALY